MITSLRIQNFKSWADTGFMRLAPITGLFGANSSGKTSILQFLLALKQTVDATDRSRVLLLGDDRSLVDLGTFYDFIHLHNTDSALSFSLDWRFPGRAAISELSLLFDRLRFEASLRSDYKLRVEHFSYHLDSMAFDMEHAPLYKVGEALSNVDTFLLKATGFEPKPREGVGVIAIPFPPVHFYGFPDIVYAYYTNLRFLADLALHLENLFNRIFYLGPLREYPRHTYTWGGDALRDVGQRGELAVPALLASRSADDVELEVVEWLQRMGLIHSFDLKPIAEHRKEYEVKVRKTPNSPEVLITDVGFGVSQVLPVLVMCYYVPEGSILILEQPEIHLHPSVQYHLADALIDAMQTRNIQIILESHSEHLLQRLQRRIAENGELADKMALYFCEMKETASALTALRLDEYGNISNWPPDFFGDEMGELTARTVAAVDRQENAAQGKVK